MNLGGPTNARGLASVTSRAGNSDLVHNALDATRQGNRSVSDGGRSKAIVEGVSVHGGLKSEEASGEGEVKNGVLEANKGGPIPSTGCLLLKEAHDVWRCVYMRQGKGSWECYEGKKFGECRAVFIQSWAGNCLYNFGRRRVDATRNATHM